MYNSASLGYTVTIGSTNGVIPVTGDHNEQTYWSSDTKDWVRGDVDFRKLNELGNRYSSKRRSKGANADTFRRRRDTLGFSDIPSYRQDSISDINWGMTVIANGIKVISAILTILAADDTDR